jgi:mono/diheme cytochrome c family protein
MKTLFLICLTLVCGLTACRSSRRGEPLTQPLRTANSDVENGRVVFMRHCYQCHPNGSGGLGPGLNDKPVPGFLMKTQVRLGLGKMPGFSKEKIPSGDLDDLVKYIIALRRADDPVRQ